MAAWNPGVEKHATTRSQMQNPGGGGGEEFGISSDGDDRMEPKVKTQKYPWGFQQNPQKSLDQKLTLQKSHADFVALQNCRKG